MDLNPSLGFGFGLVDHSSFIGYKLEGCTKSRRDGPDKRWYFGLSSHFMRFQYIWHLESGECHFPSVK